MPIQVGNQIIINDSQFKNVTLADCALLCESSDKCLKILLQKGQIVTIHGTVDNLNVIQDKVRVGAITSRVDDVSVQTGDITISDFCGKVSTESGNIIFPQGTRGTLAMKFDIYLQIKGYVKKLTATSAFVDLKSAESVYCKSGQVMCYGRVGDAESVSGCIAASSRMDQTSVPQNMMWHPIRHATSSHIVYS